MIALQISVYNNDMVVKAQEQGRGGWRIEWSERRMIMPWKKRRDVEHFEAAK
jgi:hypothetical protein